MLGFGSSIGCKHILIGWLLIWSAWYCIYCVLVLVLVVFVI